MTQPTSSASFEPAFSFTGSRPGWAFKLGPQGLGYYFDPVQTLIPELKPKLPERWREVPLREVRLNVHPDKGAGLSLAHSDFGFAVEKISDNPGQILQNGDVIVAVEGRLLAGLSAPQMQASFQKRCAQNSRLAVAVLSEAKRLSERDPSIVDCWDAQYQRTYFFHKKTGKSAWTVEELQTSSQPSEVDCSKAPIDLASFLMHGFQAPQEPPKKKTKTKSKTDAAAATAGALGKDDSDLARDERKRWADWNEGGRGGYTDQFFSKYRNCHAFEGKVKKDKRLEGSVGPGQGMEYMARWTGSKNSFN